MSAEAHTRIAMSTEAYTPIAMSTEAQIEEKRQKDLGGRHRADEETWADKFGSHRPLPFPEQSRDPGGPSQGEGDQGGALLNLESHRAGDISGGAGADDK